MKQTSPQSIPDAFAAVAAAMPEHIALACADLRITYAELALWSDAIAARLRQHGVRPGSVVGLFMPRSAQAIAAILGILKAGAAYLPFDPSYPLSVLRFLYEDSAPSLMLVSETNANVGEKPVFWNGEALEINADSGALPEVQPPEVIPLTNPDDLAYIMYTSGSTGRPKGVLIPHRGVLRLVLDNSFARLSRDEILLQLSPLSFDASTFEIWGALLNGGTLALLPALQPSLEEITQAIEHYGVTTLWLTAGIFHLMVDHRLDALRPLRQLLTGGDVLSPPHVAQAVRALPQTQIINGYGPTENTTFSCCYAIPRDFSPDHPIPIGKAIGGTAVYVLDSNTELVRDGQEGELYVGGAGLAHRYLNRPALTAERFIPHPFDSAPSARLYRTGDRVRRDADGNLHFLGRVDRQIKINGKRVELDEIEACLRRSARVRDAAVISVETAGQRRVAAFITLADKQPESVEQVRAFLKNEMPDYMQPSTLSVLDALPLSPTGKVDRACLPVPTQIPSRLRTPTDAAGDIEAALRIIWSQVLGANIIHSDDNFFDLGGTSLQMIEVHAAIQASLKRDARLVDLFTYPNIGTLAKWIQNRPPAHTSHSTAQQRASRQRAALHDARHPR